MAFVLVVGSVILLGALAPSQTTLAGLILSSASPPSVEPDDFSCTTISQIPLLECLALTALYNGTNGPQWINRDGWLQTDTPCTWYGVSCSAGHVTAVNLFSNNLTGPIPYQLSNLTELRDLYLDANHLNGSIPYQLGYLSNLQYLDLSSNQLSGPIPTQFSNLTSLRKLWLSSNQLSGTIPVELASLANLQELWLADNQLAGNIPSELDNLANLSVLSLSTNQLSGTIPAELTNLVLLQLLDLSANQLTGSIPPGLGSMANLRNLSLNGNRLTGGIPPQLGNLVNLRYLYLDNNQLSGAIPSELGSLTNLEWMGLHHNLLIGSIPSQLGSLSRLNGLNLAYNQLSGNIPTALGSLTSLQWLDLRSNHLSGAIPTQLGNLHNLQYLLLSANQLTGSIPPQLGNLTYLQELHLASNQLGDRIPDHLCDLTISQYSSHDLGYNMLTEGPECIFHVDPDWMQTQTVRPSNLQATWQPAGQASLTWTPILYNGDGGYYQISYATNLDGPYIVAGTTTDKHQSSYLVTGLTKGPTYYFRVRTFTPAHDEQQNELWSDYSIARMDTADTPTPSPTLTSTPTPTDTPTATSTPMPSDTPTPTDTMTPSPTSTVTPTDTPAVRVHWQHLPLVVRYPEPTTTPTATALPPCWPDCEPNETFRQAHGPLASGQGYQGHIESETDQNDYFFVDMGTAHTIEVSLRNIPVGANYHLYLYDSVQNLVGYSGNAGNADEYILTNPLLASRYYVRVQRVAGFSPAQAYLLQVRYQ